MGEVPEGDGDERLADGRSDHLLHGEAGFFGQDPHDHRATGLTLARPHPGTGETLQLIEGTGSLSDLFSDILFGEVLAAANNLVIHCSS
jgi:hypothetical protein